MKTSVVPMDKDSSVCESKGQAKSKILSVLEKIRNSCLVTGYISEREFR